MKAGEKATIKKCAVGTAHDYIGRTVTILPGFIPGGGMVQALDGKIFPVMAEEIEVRKFKKGQHVILHRAKNGGTLGIPVECFGGEAIVDEVRGNFSYHINMIDRYNGAFGWKASEDMLEAVHTQVAKKIVVTTDGKETLARMYEDGKVVKKATARCSDDDEFDFETGARIALSRLITGEEKPEKPKYYTGKFIAVKARNGLTPIHGTTIGKIYEAEKGFYIDDDKDKMPTTGPKRTLDEISIAIGYDLLEVKE